MCVKKITYIRTRTSTQVTKIKPSFFPHQHLGSFGGAGGRPGGATARCAGVARLSAPGRAARSRNSVWPGASPAAAGGRFTGGCRRAKSAAVVNTGKGLRWGHRGAPPAPHPGRHPLLGWTPLPPPAAFFPAEDSVSPAAAGVVVIIINNINIIIILNPARNIRSCSIHFPPFLSFAPPFILPAAKARRGERASFPPAPRGRRSAVFRGQQPVTAELPRGLPPSSGREMPQVLSITARS